MCGWRRAGKGEVVGSFVDRVSVRRGEGGAKWEDKEKKKVYYDGGKFKLRSFS